MKALNKIGYLKKISYSLFVMLMITQTSVSAITQNDINSILGGTAYYDPSSTAVSCSQFSSQPGSGAPDGSSFPNLDPSAMSSAINTWITQQNSNSTLKGLGSTIVAGAQNSNVNPFLIIAIANKETSMADPGSYNVKYANNSFSREATSSQPNYPGAGVNAGTLWYKWSSVEASVDNTAAENQNASGGGDIASYIRNEYSSQLDSNNLTAMLMKYAPPLENDTAQYIAQVTSWINELVTLTTGQASSGNDSSTTTNSGCGSASCADGSTASGSAAILCEAQKYAGIYYLLGGGHQSYSTFRQNCPEGALPVAASSSTADSPGPCATDCSGLVSVAVDGAFNQNFVWTVSNSDGTMIGGGADGWQSIPVSQAAAGDIVTTTSPDGHVEIVDHVSGSTIYTFGSHHTGTQTGQITTQTSYWVTGAWHWAGPGGTSS